ncbi:MAG: EamA family transporter [Patescibacteria group bacterium]
MSWLIVALSAYLLLAVANLLDKFVVDNVLKSAKAYAFAACILGLIVLVIAPWFLKWPGFFLLFLNLFAGFVFAVALWSLYEALKRGEAARILVFIGGLTPVFSIIFSILFFKESFTSNQWLGMTLLLIGAIVIAFLPQSRSYLTRVLNKLQVNQNIGSGGLWVALLSALAYSSYFIISKYTYADQPFLSAFLWNRLGAGLFVLIFLIRKTDREKIISLFKKKNPNKNNTLVVFNQILGASGFMLQNYAIFLGSVAIVNALQGFQYAFLLIISAGLAVLSPKLLKVNFSWKIILQKTLAVILIMIGLYFIAT